MAATKKTKKKTRTGNSRKKSRARSKKKIIKKRRVSRKRNAHLLYLDNVAPIDSSQANKSTLSEAYNKTSSMPEFAIMSEDGRQIGPWMRCKDYVQDCIWGGMFKESYQVHGFKYTHGEDPAPNLKKLHLAVRFITEKHQLADMLENIKKTVENLEERISIPKKDRTKFSRVIDNYFIVYGSKHWLKATHSISFFTFLIRATFLNIGRKIETIGTTPPCGKDTFYFKNGRKYMEMLSEHGIKGVESNWDSHKSASACHDDGFVAWSDKNGGKDKPKDTEEDTWEF